MHLRSLVRQVLRNNVAATFMLTKRPDSRVLGSYTLSSSTIALDELPKKLARILARYPQLPATPLGRLAVGQSART